MQQEKGKQY